MITKSKSNPAHNETIGHTAYGNDIKVGVIGDENIIEYEAGPKYRGFHCNWKTCKHTFTGISSGSYMSGHVSWYNQSWNTNTITAGRIPSRYVTKPNAPVGYFPRAAHAKAIRDQLDLNCHDCVLLYSGVIQAVPLLGGALRFNRIMKDLMKYIKKGMRTQPFTTVIRSAISADFINRFVVRPTLDDAQKFLDAHNYVVRVMNTAAERSAAPFKLESHIHDTLSRSTSTIYPTVGFDSVSVSTKKTVERYVDTKTMILMSAGWNTSAISPIKLWATRLGVNRPLDSVWDLVPFSFVVDYFTKAGDFISELGDKLSSQDGLIGKVSAIHDAWQTIEAAETQTFEGQSWYNIPYKWSGSNRSFTSSTEVYKFGSFERKRIGNPWGFLSTVTEDEGLFSLDLSATRWRTLAELLLQGKILKVRP